MKYEPKMNWLIEILYLTSFLSQEKLENTKAVKNRQYKSSKEQTIQKQ